MSSPIVNVAATIRRIMSYAKNPLDDSEKKIFIATAIGRALATFFPLPTSPVNSVAVHFATTFESTLDKIISGFNENLIVDTRLTRDLTFKFYQLRYDLVFTPISFEQTLARIAAVLPDYFPQNVRTVLDKEAARTKDEGECYYESWSMLVRYIADAVAEEQSNQCGIPVAAVNGDAAVIVAK